MSTRQVTRELESTPESPDPLRLPPGDEPPARAGYPLWVGIAIVLVGLLACAGVLFARWQREQGYQAETAALNREAATAEAVRAAAATATSVARPAAAPRSTAAPGVPEVTVERVEPATSPLAREIQAAQNRYWDAYGYALYYLDTSRLSEVATGRELERMVAFVERVRGEGYALQVGIDHNFFVFNTSDSTAYLWDKATNRSLPLDAVTKQPVKANGLDPMRDSRGEHIYTYERIAGTWKVTDSFGLLNPSG